MLSLYTAQPQYKLHSPTLHMICITWETGVIGMRSNINKNLIAIHNRKLGGIWGISQRKARKLKLQ